MTPGMINLTEKKKRGGRDGRGRETKWQVFKKLQRIRDNIETTEQDRRQLKEGSLRTGQPSMKPQEEIDSHRNECNISTTYTKNYPQKYFMDFKNVLIGALHPRIK